MDRLIVAARSAMERASTTFGIEGSMILCFGRDCTPKENEANFKMALRYQGKGIWGIDTAGPETEPLMKRHPYLRHYYTMAAARKLRSKCHTGETLNDWTEEELAYVLEVLQPEHLGHGVQIHRYPRLMKLASARNTQLEICLSSNLATGVVRNLRDFKSILHRLEEHQVKFAFHADATFLLETNIAREHVIANAIQGA